MCVRVRGMESNPLIGGRFRRHKIELTNWQPTSHDRRDFLSFTQDYPGPHGEFGESVERRARKYATVYSGASSEARSC